eukprot:3951286-Pyramimonas_sp.AAC.1
MARSASRSLALRARYVAARSWEPEIGGRRIRPRFLRSYLCPSVVPIGGGGAAGVAVAAVTSRSLRAENCLRHRSLLGALVFGDYHVTARS